MKDKELRESVAALRKEWDEWKRYDRDWSSRWVGRIASLEEALGFRYEYVKPIEGKYMHRKVKRGE